MGNELVSQQQAWEIAKKQARAFLMSGYLREEFTKGVSDQEALAKVVTIMSMGDELGIGRMQALRSINVIKGKPALAAELMLALCFKKIPGFKASFTTPTEKQHLECTVIFQRPGGDPNEFKFTIEDAKKAGLEFVSFQGKPTSWTKYPRAMLRARVISEGLRAVAPDATIGMMTLEELGHEVVEVESVEANAHVDTKQPSDTAEKPLKIENKPIPEKTTTGNTPGYDERTAKKLTEACTEAQLRKLHAMEKAAVITHAEVKAYIKENFGHDSSKLLSKSEIQEVFFWLESFVDSKELINQGCDRP